MKRLNNKNTYNHHTRNIELFDAVLQGNISKVKYFITIRADVNAIHDSTHERYSESYEHCTCLFIALTKDYFEIAKMLIDAGADVNAPVYLFSEDFSEIAKPSLYPIDATLYRQKPCIEGLRLLLAGGATLTHDSTWNPLFSICTLKSKNDRVDNKALYECVEELVKAGVLINYVCPLYGHTSLFMAAVNGNKEVVKLLLKNGATPNLASALLLGKDEEMLYFLLHGPDNQSKIEYVLYMASEYNNIELINRILKEGVSLNTTSFTSTYLKRCPLNATFEYDTVKFLLEHGADPNYIMDGEYYPSILCTQIHGDSLDKLNLLLEYGVTTNHKYSDYRTTVLQIAVRSELPFKKANILLKHGADIYARDTEGASVMHYALTNEYKQDTNCTLRASLQEILFTIDLLIEHGVLPNVEDNRGNTPLHQASANGYGKIILQKLINLGINPSTRNHFGETALDSAIKANNKEAISFLTSKGTEHNIFASFVNDTFYELLEKINHVNEFNIFDSEYNTLLHYATQRGLFSIVRALIKKGTIINRFNASHETPLDLAIKNNHIIIIEYLRIHKAKTYKDLNIKTCRKWLSESSDIFKLNYSFSGFNMKSCDDDIKSDPNSSLLDSQNFESSLPLTATQKKLFKAVFNFISLIFKLDFREVHTSSKTDLFIGQSDYTPQENSLVQVHSANGSVFTKANLKINLIHFDDRSIREYPNYCFSMFLKYISRVLGLARIDESMFNTLDPSILQPIIKTSKDFTEPQLYSELDYLRLSSRYKLRDDLLPSSIFLNKNDAVGNKDILEQIVKDRDIKKLQQAVESDVNIKDEYGNSFMYLASIFEFIEGVKFLHKKGAKLDLASALILNLSDDVNKIVNKKTTQENYNLLNYLMLIAILRENITLVKALIKYGVHVSDEIFFLSIEIQNIELIKVLIAGGANINAINKDKEDAAYIAANVDSTGQILSVLQKGQGNILKKKEAEVIDFKTGRTIK